MELEGFGRVISRARCGVAAFAFGLALNACVTPPPPEPAPPVPPPPPPVQAAEPPCPACVDQSAEIARLQKDLAMREGELRDLRSSQREQVKVIVESTREVTRAKAKMRRLATQADAASYIAEVEVALKALRAALPKSSAQPLLALAEGLLDSATAPFDKGDYAAAMDRAAQAEQLVTVVAERQAKGTRARVPGELPLQVAIPVRVIAEGPLRRKPTPKAPVVVTLKKDSLLVAQAYKGTWMRVETSDGKSGWVSQAQLGAR